MGHTRARDLNFETVCQIPYDTTHGLFMGDIRVGRTLLSTQLRISLYRKFA